jgi:hypothetical protein
MKSKILNLLLVFSSLLGYLEWGTDNHSFLFQAESEIISKLFSDPGSAIHPLTILPLIGQLLLLFTLVQKTPSRRLTYWGMAGLGILLLVVLLVGILGRNYNVALSTLPFWVFAYLRIRDLRKSRPSV